MSHILSNSVLSAAILMITGCSGGIEAKSRRTAACDQSVQLCDGQGSVAEQVPNPVVVSANSENSSSSPVTETTLKVEGLPARLGNNPKYEITVSGPPSAQYVFAFVTQNVGCESVTTYSLPLPVENLLSGVLTDGKHRLCLKHPKSKLVSEIISYDFEIDSSVPTLELSSAPTQTYDADIHVAGSCESGLPVQLIGEGIEPDQDMDCSQTGTFNAILSLSAGAGEKSFSITQKDAAGNVAKLDLVVTRRPLPRLAALVIPPTYQSAITADKDSRLLAVDGVHGGQFVSVSVMEDDFAATDLVCNDLPPYVTVKGETINLDLINRTNATTYELNCSTGVGVIIVRISTIATRLSFAAATKIENWTRPSIGGPMVTRDGRLLIWTAVNTNSKAGMVYFARELATGLTHVISSQDGTMAGALSGFLTDIQISPDGTFALFSTGAPELGLQMSSMQIVRKSLVDFSQPVEVVSVAVDGVTKSQGPCQTPSISSDGSFALFVCQNAANMGAPGVSQVVRKSLTNLATAPVIISVDADGTTRGSASSGRPIASYDKSFALFYTSSANLGVTTGIQMVKKNLQNLATPPVVVSVGADGMTQAGNISTNPVHISSDGAYVFMYANTPEMGVTNSVPQVVRKSLTDLATPAVVMSVDVDGVTQHASVISSFFNPDGKWMVYTAGSMDNPKIYRRSLENLSLPPVLIAEPQGADFPLWVGDYFSHTGPSGRIEFFSGARDGLRGIFTRVGDVPNAELKLLIGSNFVGSTNNWNEISDVTFAPDNSRVVFASAYQNYGVTTSNKLQIIDMPMADRSKNVRVISVEADGITQGVSDQSEPVVTPDGNFVIFVSKSSNLTGSASFSQIVRKSLVDLESPVEVISVAADGVTIGNGHSLNPVISPDGQKVIFASRAANLGATGGSNYQIISKSLTNLATAPTVISVTAAGMIGNGHSDNPVVSASGQFVVFTSRAANLGAVGGTNYQIIKKSLTNLATAPIVLSVIADGVTVGDGTSRESASVKPALTNDDAYVFFSTRAANLGATGGANFQIVRKSINSLATSPLVISVAADGTTIGSSSSTKPLIAPDGSFVVFQSTAANFGVVSGITQVFRKYPSDLAKDPELLTVNEGNSGPSLRFCNLRAINLTGTKILFSSDATDLGIASGSWFTSYAQLFQLTLP